MVHCERKNTVIVAVAGSENIVADMLSRPLALVRTNHLRLAHWLRLPLQGRSTGPHWRATPGLLASSEGGNPLQDVPVWCDVITGVKATHGCQFLEDKQ